MRKTEVVTCLECDHEHECALVAEYCEHYISAPDFYLDVPDECENCGEPLDAGGSCDEREDFHSDI